MKVISNNYYMYYRESGHLGRCINEKDLELMPLFNSLDMGLCVISTLEDGHIMYRTESFKCKDFNIIGGYNNYSVWTKNENSGKECMEFIDSHSISYDWAKKYCEIVSIEPGMTDVRVLERVHIKDTESGFEEIAFLEIENV